MKRMPKPFYFLGFYFPFWCNNAFGSQKEFFYKDYCCTLKDFKKLRDWLTKAIEWMEEKK